MRKANPFASFIIRLTWTLIFYLLVGSPAQASQSVKFKQANHLIIISVLVNGAGPFDFAFDTGASSSVIDQELTKQLKLTSVENTSMMTVAGSEVVPRYRLDSLTVSSKSVENIMVLSTEMREIHSINSRIRGILGQNFLSVFNYILNYRERSIEFEESGEFEKRLLGTRLPVERDRRRVIVVAKSSSSAKGGARLVIDSGASSIVVFGPLLKSGFDIEMDLNEMNAMVNLSSIVGSRAVRTGSIRKLQIGEEKFANLPVRLVQSRTVREDRPEDGLIPASLFQAIYFNNRENIIILNPRFVE